MDFRAIGFLNFHIRSSQPVVHMYLLSLVEGFVTFVHLGSVLFYSLESMGQPHWLSSTKHSFAESTKDRHITFIVAFIKLRITQKIEYYCSDCSLLLPGLDETGAAETCGKEGDVVRLCCEVAFVWGSVGCVEFP